MSQPEKEHNFAEVNLKRIRNAGIAATGLGVLFAPSLIVAGLVLAAGGHLGAEHFEKSR